MRSTLWLAVFGASGASGRALIDAALDRGHTVRAQCRAASTWTAPGSVEVFRGEPVDPVVARATVAGANAVVLLFGPRPPHRDVFCAAATRTVIEAMKHKEVHRLLCVTGAMAGVDTAHLTFPARLMAAAFRRSRPEVAADRDEQERLVRDSGLAWTLVKPPRLTHSPHVSGCSAAADARIGLRSSISRATLADFMLQAIEQNLHLGELAIPRGTLHVLHESN